MPTFRKTGCPSVGPLATPIDAPWWDESHHAMWRLTGWTGLGETLDRARRVGRECAPESSAVLAALDCSGLASLMDPPEGSASRAGLAVFELARVDGGIAASMLSGCLPQIPIREFGTAEQRARYLDRSRYPHGALCLTEELPGAGMDAAFLSGRFSVADWPAGGERVLRVEKRGRFISHMEFADFVVVAAESGDPRIAAGGLVLVEPGDPGVFDRGAPVRKLGHRLSSLTCPVFDVEVPASRILGGYTIEGGCITPRVGYRQALGPALRFGRTMASLMTAAKVLTSVENALLCGQYDLERLMTIWAGGEAAASLGFAAARASGGLDRVLFPAAKLFSSAHAVTRLESGPAPALMDAQVEAVFLGPEGLQRREISAWMADPEFLATFPAWAGEMADLGAETLAGAMRLWHWTIEYMRRSIDANGERLFSEVRHGAVFPMADALCRLLAARALLQDVQQLRASWSRLFSGLSTLESVGAAGEVVRICESSVFGYGVPAALDQARFRELRNAVYRPMNVASAARAAVATAIKVHFGQVHFGH